MGRHSKGFTLVEAIISMVILGIISGMLATFMVSPIKGYIDTTRRARLTDVADLALKRFGLDLRTSVPNSIRLNAGGSTATTCAASATGCFLEFIPARDGGRYCTDLEPGCDALSFSAAGDSFDIISPNVSVYSDDSLIVYNTQQSGLDAYAVDNPPTTTNNRRTIASAKNVGAAVTLSTTTAKDVTQITLGGSALSYPSPSSRFQIVSSTGPVTYACETVGGTTNGTGFLNRYTGYGYSAAQPTSALGTAARLADYVAACQITYNTVSARNGIVSIKLTITREGESVTLLNQIHVDNLP